ncbi:MAG: 4-hydroxy-tetrahydrodipicolinate reductase [Candidatus Bipolaricaulota bacterium]|nr:4-hydroxy-tetrahydrodipicolinate reductase [Candidatus Bipolaricaulota bacterium]MCS7274490.1 4-hydroxy-tetrahydrodipicolinate reductase [Candidatus Bipolaricaulota bacterium]MDW8111113.1 4-hydroxy-tetrahydrodipicolinate reductase [Candidatus Bipolaricaulota bacterium]MDW8329057.1 4-hydroxy-tetrahydrodipicolinate reductase [Candidatus Bipolaricaulota bacterium]
MRIGLIGHGKMGQEVERLALQRGHRIAHIFTRQQPLTSDLREIDILIDFSVPEAVPQNVHAAARAQISIVEGTTGWYDRLDEIRKIVEGSQIGFLYAPNFSLGVHLFFRIVEHAGRLFDRFPEYDLWVHEIHHHQKLDSPSGTALALGEILLRTVRRKREVLIERPTSKIAPHQLQISSTRVGSVPGTHIVGFDSLAETIELTHTARNRAGFALGALAAAEWLVAHQKIGFFTMDDFLDEIFNQRRDSG